METISRFLLTFLLNAAWQVTLVAAVAALTCRLMRNGPASHRHAVWVAALAISLLLPTVSLRTIDQSVSLRLAVPSADRALAAANSAPASPGASPAAAVPPSPSRTISYAPSIGAALLAAYLLFVLFRCMALLWSWIRTERIRTDADVAPMPPAVEKVWRRCLEAFGIRDIELLQSSTVQSPVAAGAWRRTIILPASLLSGTSEDVLTTAIGHEMAHLARHDFALKVLYEVAWLPLSFHPAAFVIRRGIEQTREMACDELVTRNLLDAGVYARSIMTIAAAMTAVPRPGYTLGVFDGDILEQRIRRLVERPAANLARARLLLATGLGALGLCAVIASSLAISARAQGGAAQGEMKLGVDAYNQSEIQTAVQHFQSAVALEPGNIRPKLFLANSLLRQYNTQTASDSLLAAARQQYLDALTRDPQNRQALQGMAQTALYTRQYTEARDWLNKLLAQDPNDEPALYTMGFIDWSTAYPPYMAARGAAGMRPETPGIVPDSAARQKFRDQYGSQIEEGLRVLQTALQIKPDDSDAMAYLNLLDRIKAAMVDSSDESTDLIRQADDWLGKAVAAKRQRAQNPKPAETLDLNATPPGPGEAPPPPPPPPPPSNQPASAVAMHPHNVAEMGGTFWQVTQGNTFANALAGSLKTAGFPVRIVAAPDGLVRVMVGPYQDQASLDQAKSALATQGITVVREW